MDFCCKSGRFADFENTVDNGSALNFGVGSGLFLSGGSILGHNQNLDHRSFCENSVDAGISTIASSSTRIKIFPFSCACVNRGIEWSHSI